MAHIKADELFLANFVVGKEENVWSLSYFFLSRDSIDLKCKNIEII